MGSIINRREFTGTLGMGLFSILTGSTLINNCQTNPKNKIDSIQLYLVNVKKERNFSHSTWHNRQHIFIKIQSGKHSGWAETLASKNNLEFDIEKWGLFLRDLKGMSITEGIEYGRTQTLSSKWNPKMSEPVLIALNDLLGKKVGKPTIELWALEKRDLVPGLFCILEKDLDQALIQAQIAKDQNLTSHVKVKMFGLNAIDMALTTTLRKFFGEETFLMADANRGYKKWKNIDELAGIMKNLHSAGLDAMEDPAELTVEEWTELQSKVGDFSLIPDRPMRPANKALEIFSPGMGHYFNIHPDTMGTFKEAIQLGRMIKENDRGLMIGDSSLIGPACTFWQQVAIGLGASWVEAIEKPQESDVFQQCVSQKSTMINDNGEAEITHLYPGFGIEMDEEKLSNLSDKSVTLF